MNRTKVVGLVLTSLVFANVSAQDVPLARLLPEFFVAGLTVDNPTHDAHFHDDGAAVAVMGQIDATLASQFATYPLSSSSGAFTTQIDPETGAEVATSESFGPIFAERPETLGRGKITVGVTSLGYEFDSLDGFTLDEGEILLNLVHEDENSDGSLNPAYEGDVITSRLFLNLKLRTNILFGNFGVTDRLDLGIAVPQVRAEMDAVVRSTILPLSQSGVHFFVPTGTCFAPCMVQDDPVRGEASGIGDVVLRGKYNFTKGFALGLDIRLPTGDEENLLGTGATQVKLTAIARGPKYDIFYGGFHPHMNLGYLYSTGGQDLVFTSFTATESTTIRIEPSSEVNYALGFDTALGERVTLAADVIGRVLLGTQTLSARSRDFFYKSNVNQSVQKETLPEVITTENDVNLLAGTVGLKIRTYKTLLVTVSGILPILGDRGLQAPFVASVGLDYTFN